MNSKKIVGFMLCAVIFSASTVFAESSYKLNQKRIFGRDRYETSALISKDGWQNSSNVIICNGENFPDALCAVPLAKKYGSPILLTSKNGIDENVSQELKRLNPDRVTIIGGKAVMGDMIENQIKADLPNLKELNRLGGNDRYETSRIIADEVGNNGEVVLVSGKAPSDALSISAIAANKNMPILLADDKEDNIQSYFGSNTIKKTYIIGGQICVGENIEKISPNPERIYGVDRYESNQKILSRFQEDMNFSNIYITAAWYDGVDQFADALSSAALAAKDSNPVVLVNSTINDKTLDIIKSKVTKDSTIIAIGGEKLVSPSLVDNVINIKNTNSGGNNNSGGSGSLGDSSPEQNYYNVSTQQSFPGAFTYDLKLTSSDGTQNLKGYKLLYDGIVIASDEDEDGIVKPLAIFFGDDTDKSKFQILKDGKYINFKGIK